MLGRYNEDSSAVRLYFNQTKELLKSPIRRAGYTIKNRITTFESKHPMIFHSATFVGAGLSLLRTADYVSDKFFKVDFKIPPNSPEHIFIDVVTAIGFSICYGWIISKLRK